MGCDAISPHPILADLRDVWDVPSQWRDDDYSKGVRGLCRVFSGLRCVTGRVGRVGRQRAGARMDRGKGVWGVIRFHVARGFVVPHVPHVPLFPHHIVIARLFAAHV